MRCAIRSFRSASARSCSKRRSERWRARRRRRKSAGGGRLQLALEAGDKFVELRITDSGQGIAPEHLAKIFDPFFSTKEHGTGLGLALTQQIVVEHGGTIEVASEPGKGTTFTVRLPAV